MEHHRPDTQPAVCRIRQRGVRLLRPQLLRARQRAYSRRHRLHPPLQRSTPQGQLLRHPVPSGEERKRGRTHPEELSGAVTKKREAT